MKPAAMLILSLILTVSCSNREDGADRGAGKGTSNSTMGPGSSTSDTGASSDTDATGANSATGTDSSTSTSTRSDNTP